MEGVILVVEDDRSIRDITRIGLTDAGFSVVTASDGDEALAAFRRHGPDAVVLDVMLPKRDGLEVLRSIRASSTTPVVMLTARDGTTDVVLGLELGADDYITKPFEMPILVARLRSALRRSHNPDVPERLSIGDVVIDVAAHRVTRAGDPIELSPTEFRLLVELAGRPGRVFTREMLLENVWGYPALGDTRLVDVAVQRLRSKLEKDPSRPEVVVTVRGFGYRAGSG
ncbi:MAG TPA: response regulator transcription factor [Acidimicrobiia bacterium]|nr:response regulator transcription factor [Acidimicrobiia bacterium]